ncbi:hypothetical protein PHYSODRAFT_324080 [Phytophthora sojae]|uniref:DDE-1 domain-containing protein n=1 Tax=Phytophthora sojae (strain P6497) TaxID=1094619 RepID=G4YP08_PHYSP|nr:hypothetical protein PHYSODRAFT_324080 [Phytophthora sojae]EGZ30768.1 hypothetical protein PHYSODRAFT_324080 [Phytophthora sojae]|eukprot:XP_009518043.1 hypothetical protein PHYSODRAFT_324080 [Phytophthora sojae]
MDAPASSADAPLIPAQLSPAAPPVGGRGAEAGAGKGGGSLAASGEAYVPAKADNPARKVDELEARLRSACSSKMRSTVTRQGRRCSFSYDDAVLQWIKQLRQGNIPLKTSHVVIYVKEDDASWDTPNRTVMASVDLEHEQQAFASTTGAAISRARARACIWNADETAVYYDEEPSTVIAESGSKKAARVLGRKRSQRASVLLASVRYGEEAETARNL